MRRPLILSRRLAPLFCCHFFAAFNDNFLKTALVFLVLFRRDFANPEALITSAGAVFIAPYFFLSALGGELADRYDKARVAQYLKFAEILVAVVAAIAFTLGSVTVLFVTLAAFGVIAALFGPIKYGILPDHLQRKELPAGNALIEGATFIAILTGTIVGGLASAGGANNWTFTALVIGFAIACWLSSLLIPATGSGAPRLKVRRNIAASTAAMLRHLHSDPKLWWGSLVTSWFWLVGIVVLSLLPPLIKNSLGGDEQTVTLYLALFSVAIGVGSGLAAILARGRIRLSITLAGAALLALFSLDIGWSTLNLVHIMIVRSPLATLETVLGTRMAIDLVGLSIAGGLFIVPVFAAVQAWSPPAYRARTVAAVNVLNAAFMTGASVLVAVLQKNGVSVPELFLGIGVTTALVAFAIWRTMPKAR